MSVSKKKFFQLFKKLLPCLALILVVFLFFWKVFIKGYIPFPGDFTVGVYFPWLDYKWGYEAGVPVKNPITADVPSFVYPMQNYSIAKIREGSLPLWNPNILGGTPLMANFQAMPFTLLLGLIFNDANAWTVQIILQHILASVFAFILLRHWKASRIGSFLGSAVFAFSGFNLIWSQWNGHTLASAFIPLILYFEDRFLSEGKAKFAFGLTIALFLQIVSGYPQIVLYTILSMLVLWSVGILGDKKRLIKTAVVGVFAVLSVGLAGFLIIPGYELLSLSQRTKELHPFEWTFLPFEKAITFVAPDFFGNHSTGNYWGPQDYTSNTGFVGVVSLSLALLGLPFLKKRKEIAISFLLGIGSLALAFPTFISTFIWKSGFLGFNAASAHRSLVLFNLGMALLSAFGYDYLKNVKKGKILLIFPFLLLLGFFAYAVNIQNNVGVRNLVIPAGVFLISSLVIVFKPGFKLILIPLAVFELFYFGWKFTPLTRKDLIFPKTPVIEFLEKRETPSRVVADRVIPINFLMNYGIETLEGYDAVYPERISKFISAVNGSLGSVNSIRRYSIIDNYNSGLLDAVNVKFLVIEKKDEKSFLKASKFKKVFEDKSVAVLENKKALPRTFFVDDWEVVKEEEKIIERLFDPGFKFDKKIILEEDPPEGTKGFVFTSDSWYPGWIAKADGEEKKVYRADYVFRAIPVDSKDAVVEYSYSPDSLKLGVKVSVASLALLIMVIAVLKLQND